MAKATPVPTPQAFKLDMEERLTRTYRQAYREAGGARRRRSVGHLRRVIRATSPVRVGNRRQLYLTTSPPAR